MGESGIAPTQGRSNRRVSRRYGFALGLVAFGKLPRSAASQCAAYLVWKNAAEQIFYSLSLAEGMIICFGGFNEFKNRLHEDVLVVALADFIVSMMGGMVVFAVLGNMAYNMEVPVTDVVSSGVGLAFIAYPQALSRIAYPQFWSAAFYAMLFFLAIDTEPAPTTAFQSAAQFSSVECLLTPFKDEFPVLRSYGPLLSFAVCALMCVFGMPMASQGGLYILTMMDTYLGGYLLPWIGLAELLVVVFGYWYERAQFRRLRRFCTDIEFMTGDPPGMALKICWAVLCPLCLTWIVIADLFLYGEPVTLGEYTFPVWVNVVGHVRCPRGRPDNRRVRHPPPAQLRIRESAYLAALFLVRVVSQGENTVPRGTNRCYRHRS
ncbi:hypothetical protein HPB51_026063 [Rhipicephalus microplus]|uniref:Uncharacterized protein n=1 Tax=Rhipicephalus microplus TaxID=6941 RepID=A0A9J6EE80_RHIMP|nr:hypothetical protein HPB51_026063 [Rhipicephalus microplus]